MELKKFFNAMGIFKLLIILILQGVWMTVEGSKISRTNFKIDEKNITWIVGIFERSKNDPNKFDYKCQGVLFNPQALWTVGSCIDLNNEPEKNIKIRLYNWQNTVQLTKPSPYQERGIRRAGYKELTSNSLEKLEVDRTILLFLDRPLFISPKPAFWSEMESLIPNEWSEDIELDKCAHINLEKSVNGELVVRQYPAHYAEDDHALCRRFDSKNGKWVTAKTNCSFSTSIFCATRTYPGSLFLDAPANSNNNLGASLVCKYDGTEEYIVMGILVDNTPCAGRYVKF
ncbi:uncharacterized protein [Chelonus insularis]|uniref:uncharacterized protein n=1 Tax=Chelonus insularis TaxID=460826 RepID=UPI001589E3BB|nr:uncharacterized protein LOC118066699 [Chelonus insularis]